MWTAQPEDEQKCLTGLATAIITTRDNLGSCLPTGLSLALLWPAIAFDIQSIRLSICSAVFAPDHTTHLRRQTSGRLGFSKPVCGVVWRTYPKGSHQERLRPRNHPSCFSSCGGRDGRTDIPFRDDAGGQHVGKLRGANHRRPRPDSCSGENRNVNLVPTSPSLLTRTNGTHDLTFSPSCRFPCDASKPSTPWGFGGLIRTLHELFLPISSPVSPQDWLRNAWPRRGGLMLVNSCFC